MRKLLPVVIGGVMAISFSQLAAAQSVGAQGNVDADVKTKPADANVQGSTGAAVQGNTQSPAATGATGEHKQGQKNKKDRMHDERGGSGATGDRRDDHEGRANPRGDKQGEEAQPNTNKPKY
jgi:hypothetical protein